MDTKPVFHGSDIEKICSYYHLDKETIVNFGANVNPLGLSRQVKAAIASHLDLLSSYPDREYTSLCGTISEYCGIPADFILPGNGSSELISLLIEERAPKHTLILGPTYSEYSRELSFSGSTQSLIQKICAALSKAAAAIFSFSVIRTIQLPPPSCRTISAG